MKKKLLISTAAFAILFIFFFWMMFPYGNIVKMGISRAAKDAGINISYDLVDSGPFSTKFSDLEVNGVTVGDLTASYSPISLLTRNISISSKGLITCEAEISPSNVEFTAQISPEIINSYAKGKALLSSPLAVEGTGNPQGNTALIKASTDKIEVESPIGMLPFEKMNAEISIKGYDITINKLTSNDDMNLDLKGVLKINNKNMESSVVNINGTADVFGQKKNLKIIGRFSNLQTSIN